MNELESGAPAPAFSLPRDGGETVSLSDFAGRILVLYFYPRDDTSGCTRQAVAFTGLLGQFRAAGAEVLGVSKDTVASHDKFAARHGLELPLLSDAEGDLCERMGVWKRKSMYGKTFMGIERTTFLIGRDGRIARIWRKVKVPGHAEDVLEAVRAL
ncbi:redoxin domain-containing protein [Rhodobacteraceae bacterium 2CG4]|uniref:thioredoxin-dependent peroxiredoxin n=1 Tax=Halovulum marinum TaxID=2662447 RepID=A0A6L5YZD7_9RHOB|nr:peroxiredoxin [Halovulum marinum]MSU89074.1 redoxin domain-containing protein [Halovulum marinum]